MASLPKDPPEDPKKQSFWMVRIIFMIQLEKSFWLVFLTHLSKLNPPSREIMCARCTGQSSPSRPATTLWPVLWRGRRWRNNMPSSSASGATNGSPSLIHVSASVAASQPSFPGLTFFFLTITKSFLHGGLNFPGNKRSHYFHFSSMTHLCALWHVSPQWFFALSFLRATLWFTFEGVAVFLYLHRTIINPALLHLRLTGSRGGRPGESLAKGNLSKENLLWFQREPWQQHELLPCTETLEQEATEGLTLCVCVSIIYNEKQV